MGECGSFRACRTQESGHERFDTIVEVLGDAGLGFFELGGESATEGCPLRPIVFRLDGREVVEAIIDDFIVIIEHDGRAHDFLRACTSEEPKFDCLETVSIEG